MKNAGIALLVCWVAATIGCSNRVDTKAENTTPGTPASIQSDAAIAGPSAGTAFADATGSWKNATVNRELQGDIKIDGSSTVYPISEAAAASFKKLFPNVNTTVGKSGTGGGFKRFQKGETDVSDASRPVKEKEFNACRKNNVAFVEIPIAYDGLTIVVHKDNGFVDSLTVEDLKNIFLADRKAMTWKDVNPDWPAEKIQIFAPGTDSGTFDYFKEIVAGKNGAIRGDMTTSENDDVLVNGVAGGKFAIGFFGAAYYFANQDSLKAVQVVNPNTSQPILPTAETIENGSYAPFSRPLFIYVNIDSISKPQVEQFIEFYLVKAARFAREVGYVALPEEIYVAAMDNFIDEKSGTHYLTADLEKRSGPVTEVFHSKNLTK